MIKRTMIKYAAIVVSIDKKNWITGEGIPLFFSVNTASCFSEGGISGVVLMLHQTEPMEQAAPRKKEAKTQVGSLPVLPIKIIGKINKETLASVCPKPVKKLWAWKPVGCCVASNLSAMKARYGSMAVLLPASSIHNKPAAIHNALLKGNKNNAMLQTIAPIKKYGVRLPNLGCHV